MLLRLLISFKEYLILFFIFFLVYLFTGMDNPCNRDFLTYPFGSDPPCYYQFLDNPPFPGNYMIYRHPITAVYCLTYNKISSPLRSRIPDRLYYKLPFALVGAINVLLVFSVFRRLTEKYALFYSLAYGFTGVIWFFGVMPESYLVTAFLISLYLLFLIKYKDDLNHHSLAVLTALFMLGLMNEVSFACILAIPIAVYSRDFLSRDKSFLKPFVLYTIVGGLIVYIMMSAFSYSAFKRSPIDYWKTQFNVGYRRTYKKTKDLPSALYTTRTAALNFYFFNIAFPEDKVSSWFPQYGRKYIGYFEPTFRHYFDNIATTIFLITYAVLLFYGIKGLLFNGNKITIGLLSYILIRSLLIVLFNPIEALLYSSVIVLPLLMILFYYFSKSRFRFKVAFLLVFIASVFYSNLRFFLH